MHQIKFEVTDEKGNKGYHIIKVNVKDDVIPVISGNNSYTKSLTADLKISDIMEGLTANDDCDGDISDRITVIEDNYTDYKNALNRDKFVLMRHDVEYSVERAYDLSRVEESMDFTSTFFFE